MGYWKQHALEANYTPFEAFVCTHCLTDKHLQSLVEVMLDTDYECTYCETSPAAPIDVVLDAFNEVIDLEYWDPANELPYESREGGYLGTVYTGSELVEEFEDWTDNERLIEEVASSFADSHWSKRDYFGLDEYERMEYGWRRFVRQVKHLTRYLFLQEVGDGASEEIPPGRMLDEVGMILQRLGHVISYERGSRFVRARVHPAGIAPKTVAELGPPREDLARQANRMSPAGIPMFYAALEDRTAVCETFETRRAHGNAVTLAYFQNLRPISLLDLTRLPEIPSRFDLERRDERPKIVFLHRFVRELARPVERDLFEHVDYVPTQVVTEYFRHGWLFGDEKVDGLIYASSRVPEGRSVVLFFGIEDCGPRDDLDKPQFLLTSPALELVDSRQVERTELEELIVQQTGFGDRD